MLKAIVVVCVTTEVRGSEAMVRPLVKVIQSPVKTVNIQMDMPAVVAVAAKGILNVCNKLVSCVLSNIWLVDWPS